MTEGPTALRVQPGEDFVVTPYIEALCNRASAYLEVAYPVHLSGLRKRPVTLLYGDEEFGSSDLIGAEKGIVTRRLIDNFVHSVLKTEESLRTHWVDNHL